MNIGHFPKHALHKRPFWPPLTTSPTNVRRWMFIKTEDYGSKSDDRVLFFWMLKTKCRIRRLRILGAINACGSSHDFSPLKK